MASLAAASTNLAPTSGMEVVMPSLPLMSDTEDAVLEESSELVSETPKTWNSYTIYSCWKVNFDDTDFQSIPGWSRDLGLEQSWIDQVKSSCSWIWTDNHDSTFG